jgi:hypothetical protein
MAMSQQANAMAQAWLDASQDLAIRVVHPFTFTTKAGKTATTQGVYLPDFGAPAGALLLCRFDPDEIEALADDTDYFQSGLSPYHYEPYRRERYIETLNDWGWFGAESEIPPWFTGGIGRHGGAR